MNNSDAPVSPLSDTHYVEGITKREHFAGLAMQGMSSHTEFYGQSKDFAENIARDCVAFADALLKELEK